MKFALPFLLLFFLALPVNAQEFVVKDSLYFTMDDGIQSQKEMEEEAMFVHELCTSNPYQMTYFDCDCLSGAFLQIREKSGPLVMQNDILNRLVRSNDAVCANAPGIAGDAYKTCELYVGMSRQFARDNEEFCTCAANKTATDFKNRPRFSISYIRGIKMNALTYCEDPAKRARYLSSAKTAR
jgi:hypothetical protein